MKTSLAFTLGAILASGMAVADPQDENSDSTGQYNQSDQGHSQSQSQSHESQNHQAMSQSGSGQSGSVTTWDADDLRGKMIVTASGEEIGEVNMVGSQKGERVAVVDVGGFLLIADKRVAIPVSELKSGADGNLTTDLSKDSMKESEEFTEEGFTEETSSSDTSNNY